MVREHQAGLWRYLRYLGCDVGLAEDLVQDVFLAVWRRPFEDRGSRATAAYLRRAAHNRFLMAVRKKKVRPAFRDLREADEAYAIHAGDDDGAGYRAALRACLSGLRERAKKALELRYEDKKPRKAIAAALGLTMDGVKTLLRRTREALRDCIERKRAA